MFPPPLPFSSILPLTSPSFGARTNPAQFMWDPTIHVGSRAQLSPFLYLQGFCSIWPQFLGFLANSNSFCHLLSFPFSRGRKNNSWSDGPKGGPATWWGSSYRNQAQVWKIRRAPLLVYAKGNYFYPKNIRRNTGCVIKYVSTWKILHFLHLLQPHHQRLSAKEE